MNTSYASIAYCLRTRAIKLAGAFALFASALLAGSPAARAADDAAVILGFGDSLMAGYGLAQGESFPAQLEARLRAATGREVRVINAGVSGDTSAGGRARLAWSLGEAPDNRTPDLAIVELGANDALRGIDPGLTRANLAAILEGFAARDIPVLLAGMLAPPNMGADYAEAFNPIYPELAREHDVAGFYPFFLDGVAGDPALNQDDGIHPTAEGVAIMVERMLPHILGLLGEEEEDTSGAR